MRFTFWLSAVVAVAAKSSGHSTIGIVPISGKLPAWNGKRGKGVRGSGRSKGTGRSLSHSSKGKAGAVSGVVPISGTSEDEDLPIDGTSEDLPISGTSGSACRDTYIYVDHYEKNLQGEEFIDYVKSLVEAGATHVMLGFYIPGEPIEAADSVGQFAALSASDKKTLKSYMKTKGAKLMMVTGGGNYGLKYMNYEGADFAKQVCSYAKTQGYDGVDFDIEGLPAGFGPDSDYVTWAKAAAAKCKTYVDIVTSAPQSPYFGSWGAEGFDALIDDFDKLLIQYYNQGTSNAYADYTSVFQKDAFSASIGEIVDRTPSAAGKLVVGKYIYSPFGGSGQVSAADLNKIIAKGEAQDGYTGGVMIWKSPAVTDALYDQFINTDLPTLAACGTSAGPDDNNGGDNTDNGEDSVTDAADTDEHVRTRPTRPAKSTKTKKTKSTKTQKTKSTKTKKTKSTKTTKKSSSGGSGGGVIADCVAQVNVPDNDAWDADCKSQCSFYGGVSGAPWCTDQSSGDSVAACVKRLHPYCA